MSDFDAVRYMMAKEIEELKADRDLWKQRAMEIAMVFPARKALVVSKWLDDLDDLFAVAPNERAVQADLRNYAAALAWTRDLDSESSSEDLTDQLRV